ncbi:MAG: hypothetical protein JW724_03410 [Candidatus Altiarchaeota archaeon]|nr:hypothetical protein [Candidatus Altiarchaeota archaeon]
MEDHVFGKSPRHNALVLYAVSGLDVVSTYLCVRSGLYEANPLIRSFYSISSFYDSTGLLMHLVLYFLITLFIAYAAHYLREKSRKLAHAILVAYAFVLFLIALNNLLLLTGLLAG